MTVAEYREGIRQLIEDLPKIAETLCIQEALSGLTIVKNRSTIDGIFVDSKDGNYAEYSTKEVNTKLFAGKQRNSGGADYIKSNDRGTWHDFRKAQGLQSQKVNLSYTSRMWSSIGIVKTINLGGGSITILGTTDSKVDEYLPSLVRRYGNYINPTEKEASELQLDTATELLKILRRRL